MPNLNSQREAANLVFVSSVPIIPMFIFVTKGQKVDALLWAINCNDRLSKVAWDFAMNCYQRFDTLILLLWGRGLILA